MIEDEKKEGSFVNSNFQVLADQQAEQNYAVNIYKGSGEMSGMLDQMEKDAKVESLKRQEQDVVKSIL